MSAALCYEDPSAKPLAVLACLGPRVWFDISVSCRYRRYQLPTSDYPLRRASAVAISIVLPVQFDFNSTGNYFVHGQVIDIRP